MDNIQSIEEMTVSDLVNSGLHQLFSSYVHEDLRNTRWEMLEQSRNGRRTQNASWEVGLSRSPYLAELSRSTEDHLLSLYSLVAVNDATGWGATERTSPHHNKTTDQAGTKKKAAHLTRLSVLD